MGTATYFVDKSPIAGAYDHVRHAWVSAFWGHERRIWWALLAVGLSTKWVSVPIFAEPGKTGANFLKIVMSPRAVGMGESGAALSDDLLTPMALNPAGLARLPYKEASFIYNRWFEGISLQHMAYAHPTPRLGTFGFSGTMLHVEPFPGYDNSGGPTGDVRVRNSSWKLAYAARLWGPKGDARWGLFAGAGTKYVRESLENASASTVLADAGALYAFRRDLHVFAVGLSADSLGPGLVFDAERDPAPTVFRGGLSYQHPVLGDPFTLSADLRSFRDSGTSFGVGLEYLLRRVVAWRLGYASDQGVGNGFRFGVGFHLKLFRLEYALAQFGDFGFTHRMGISVRFGEPLEVLPVLTPPQEKANWHIEKAKRFTQEGRHLEAVLELNEALKLDPLNKDALRRMRDSKEALEQLR